MYKGFVVCIFVFAWSANAQAAAADKLKRFVESTRSAQAAFTQVVLDKNGKKLQNASGVMQFERPGKFRWEYREPYEQIIVGDGVKFWLYDADLNQVTVKRIDAVLGSSPAALLSGSNEIGRNFILQEDGLEQGLEWLRATPKTAEGTFRSVRMGFNAEAELVVMELHDAFGQITVLHFSKLQRNPALAPSLFRFVPPKGADVLGE